MVCVQTYSESDNTLLRYGHLKFSKVAAGRHLGFDPTGNGGVRSAGPENPTLEQNTKGVGWRVAELWQFPQNVVVSRWSVVGRQYSYFLWRKLPPSKTKITVCMMCLNMHSVRLAYIALSLKWDSLTFVRQSHFFAIVWTGHYTDLIYSSFATLGT